MANFLKVHLIGGDQSGWALDTDLRLARQSLTKELLKNAISLVDTPDKADALLTVCPEAMIENRKLATLSRNNPIIAQFSNDPIALFERVPGLLEKAKTWFCVAQTQDALKKLKDSGLSNLTYIPYIADLENFKPTDESQKFALRKTLGLEPEHFVIGSFQRDSNGDNLYQFKPQKGADILVALLIGLKNRIGDQEFQKKVRVLLAGPRRHWIRDELKRQNIPFVFHGEITRGDDFPKNILSAQKICELLNASNLYIVSSRWEGAPRAILEAASTKTALLSSNVGIARDLLSENQIFSNLSDGIDTLESEFKTHTLSTYKNEAYEKVRSLCSVEAIALAWKQAVPEICCFVENFKTMPVSSSQKVFNPALELQKKFSNLKKRFFPQQTDQSFPHPVDNSVDNFESKAFDSSVPFRVSGFFTNPTQIEILDYLKENLDLAEFEIKNENLNPETKIYLVLPFMPPPTISGENPGICTLIGKALSNKVPVVYPADYKSQVPIWFGGLSYNSPLEIPELLKKIRKDYLSYQRACFVEKERIKH